MLVDAIQNSNSQEVRNILENGFPVNTPIFDYGEITCLMRAVNFGNIEIVKIVLEHGASLESSDSCGR